MAAGHRRADAAMINPAAMHQYRIDNSRAVFETKTEGLGRSLVRLENILIRSL
jgi:hypothetical protein